MSDDDTIHVDGLGRTAGERLVDEATANVEAERLRAFVRLCGVLSRHPVSSIRTPWGRWLSRFSFEVAAHVAESIAEQVERTGLTMDNVGEFVERHGNPG